MPRIILISGKGGVGKTTVAAATAAAIARFGHRTLVLSFDLAHSLRDSFDYPDHLVGGRASVPVNLAPNLDFEEIDVYEELERDWRPVYRYVSGLMSHGGLDSALADELSVIPGMEDLAALIVIERYFATGRYDVVVLDCPPTGASLRFVGLATGLKSYAEKRLHKERRLVSVIRPLARMVTESGLYLPEDSFFESLGGIVKRIANVENLLQDPTVCSVRLVATPEKIVMRETLRAFMYFGMYGMHVDLAVVNRVFETGESYFQRWAEAQSVQLQQIRAELKGTPIAVVPMFPEEVYGQAALERVGRIIYGERDPAAVNSTGQTVRVIETGEQGPVFLEMDLPFVGKDQLEVTREDGVLAFRVGTFQRRLDLTPAMASRNLSQAKLEDGRLVVRFDPPTSSPYQPTSNESRP